MAQIPECATESVEAVAFSFLTTEEIQKTSFVKITNDTLLDSVKSPVPGGLYDPALGPPDDRSTLCKSCGQPSKHCPGHFGHIELVFPIYNPLLFNILSSILQRTCLNCHCFQAKEDEVKKFTSQLELVVKGDIIGAKKLDSPDPSESSCMDDDEWRQQHSAKNLPGKWNSHQFSEAMSILNNFLKQQHKKCQRCGFRNPKISKPTFGWFYVDRLSSEKARGNVIRKYADEIIGDVIPSENRDNVHEDIPSATSAGTTNSASKGRKKIHEKLARAFAQQKAFSGPLLPSEVKGILELLWKNEAQFCSRISDIQDLGFGKKAGHSMFFLDSILVPPTKFRPPTKGGDSVMEHPQTDLLTEVLKSNKRLGEAFSENDRKEIDHNDIIRKWMDLQQSVNMLFDNRTMSGKKDVASGICQLLEKKEGIFRQKMMGKRVNFACRSVISPDPYLAVNEIGIPPYFALRLTYPERVTPWNVVKLRDAIRNGPQSHPGATHYADKASTVKLTQHGKLLSMTSRKLSSSRGVILQHGKIQDHEFEGKIVYRHLRDGDVVLVNRQPTLHKPSIMAHVVRVLKGEKTVRMHYANCSTYNADFDGDEINVHFPQDEISRAEAYNIVNANNQYVKPTSGDPIRALIQDHIVSAALLTKKDTFLSYEEFNQLLYSSGVSTAWLGSFHGKPGRKLISSNSECDISILPPAIWKPKPLWTGKQVISALLYYIARGHAPFTVEKSAKIPRDFFKSQTCERKKGTGGGISRKKEEHDEDKLLIYKNDLVRGVVDKAQFGDFGLIHTVQELYGSNIAGNLLSSLSRLFTAFLQMHGFTCGVDDLLVTEAKDSERKKQLESCEEIGEIVHHEFIEAMDGAQIDPHTLKLNIEKKIRENGEAALTYLDRKMISCLNSKTSSGTLKVLLSEGILKPSGKNCISLMTTSGAKGSMVNFQQISSHLGQQELEGRRVPRMVSGKTLPCFPPWDFSSRAGGFIIDRFLTGLRPQEYYFHCMAGREGLVDTAVKTSRSGYLQRCLIKNLECLKVCYDHSVRDADGSIIQFHYGEDGVDVHQTSFLTKFEAWISNKEMIYSKCHHEIDKSSPYINKLPDALKEKAENFILNTSSKQRIFSSINRTEFLKLVEHKYVSSLAQPGEPVGVLASQSVGEPSTQMTLNTFHLAGRGEMNVTLGIPRLQEILMTASRDIKTPVMTCPLRQNKSMDHAIRLADNLKKITVADIIESMKVSVVPVAVDDGQICSLYKLEMKLYKPKHYPKYADILLEDWEETLETHFLRELEDAIEHHVTLLSKISGIKSDSSQSLKEDGSKDKKARNDGDGDGDNDGGGGEDAEEVEDLGTDAQKRKRQGRDEIDYEDGALEETHEGEQLEETIGEDGNQDLGTDAQKRKRQGRDEIDCEDGAGEETHEGEQLEETIGEDGNQDLGTDAQKRKRQGRDEIDCEDGAGEETHEGEQLEETIGEDGNQDESDIEVNENDITRVSESKRSKSVDEKPKRKSKLSLTKDTDRAVFVEAKGMHFEVHFRFIKDPYILLAQIASRTAKKVCIQNFGKVDQCRAITCKENQVIYYGHDHRKRVDIQSSVKEKMPALQTTGVDFNTFWELQDHLDVRYIYSNNVHAMLETYGVEAARETIIREITNVFKSYGISVNIRHLTLIADYMTHTGGYRPMSRAGSISECVSPLSKMSFETAAKFIVEAAYHGEVDSLETPSSRVCLGMPVKMGTGSFDLMQKL